MKTFNLNNYIYVLLLPKGIELWRNDFNRYTTPNFPFEKYYKDSTDDKGYSKFQAHEFIKLFGGVGWNMHQYFNINILIEEKDLK